MSEPSTTDQMTDFVADLFRDAPTESRRLGILRQTAYLAGEWEKLANMDQTFEKQRIKYARKVGSRYMSLLVGLSSL
jgi:hypothetical protein